jgi:hypothetical protein
MVGAVVVDLDGIYDPALTNDRLLLGMFSFKPEPNRAFIGLSARVTFHAQLHQFHYPQV